MKKTALIVSIAILMSFLPSVGYAAEDKTISSAADLLSFRDEVNSGTSYEGVTVTLSSSIDLSGINWEAAGTPENPFKGTFDGQNNTITGLTASGTDVYMGLFGYSEGNIKKLNAEVSLDQLYNADPDNASKANKHTYAGGIAAYNTGNIENCTVKGVAKTKNEYSYTVGGGICGINKGTISYCTNNARIYAIGATDWQKLYGDAYAGGICGINEGTVASCTASAEGVPYDDYTESIPSVYAHSTFASAAAGGAIGDNRGHASNITSSGTVEAKIDFGVEKMSYAYGGGISGSNTGSISDSSSDCYVRVTHDNAERYNYMMGGGIAGYNKNEINNCTFSGLVSGGVGDDNTIKGYIGGICGYSLGKISKCEFAKGAKITDYSLVAKKQYDIRNAVDYTGGICGYNEQGIITRCTAKGSIYPTERKAPGTDRSFFVGGVVGGNKDGVISLSYSNSDIILDGDGETVNQRSNSNLSTAETETADKDYYGGGLAGENRGRIENCYYYSTAVNSIKAGSTGGLAGINAGVLENCYTSANVNAELIKQGGGIAAVNRGQVVGTYFVIGSFEEEISGTKKSAAEITSRNLAAMKKNTLFAEWPIGICWTTNLRVNAGMPSFTSTVGSYAYSGGSGTEQSPYIIKTQQDLYNIRFNKSASYKLVNDITYDGAWCCIGDTADPFTGKIDGNHHTVTFKAVNGYSGKSGFIGHGENCYVKNLNITVSKPFTASGNEYEKLKYVGMVIAYGRNVNIENCIWDGDISVSANYVYAGGIAGDVTGTVTGCQSFGTLAVTTDTMSAEHSAAGGIVGRIGGTVNASKSEMNININGVQSDGLSETGGICGILTGTIQNSCYIGEAVNESATEKAYTGGLAGVAEGDINTSYSNARIVSSGVNGGGIAGNMYNGLWDNAYFNPDKADDNGIGLTVEGENEFTASGLLNTFRNAGDTRYIWTSDRETGMMTLLHIAPEWVIDNGFTKLALKSNSDTCEIYYTTDGSNPIGSGVKYEKPFFCDDLSTLKYYAKDGGVSTDIFDYGQAHISIYPIQFTEMPKNQNNAAITSENISETTAVTVNFISDITDTVKLYMVFYDENGVMKFANCKETALVSGENSLTFDNIGVSGVSAIRIFVWNGAMVPYTPEVKF